MRMAGNYDARAVLAICNRGGYWTVQRNPETTPMKYAHPGQADLSRWFPVAAGLVALTLTMLPLDSRAGKPADKRPDYMIGYTVHRTDLEGYHANQVTMRAFMAHGDGSGVKELGKELVTKPNQYVSFASWSPDGSRAIIYQGWDSRRWCMKPTFDSWHSTAAIVPGNAANVDKGQAPLTQGAHR